MNEISVVVNQTPGVISWNYEELKLFLEESLREYQTAVYTDETIQSAKSDVAKLRALAKSIEDRRKEVKNACLEPYAIIETQAKELVGLIDKPIQAINDQVQDYEKRRKEKVKAAICAYWDTEYAKTQLPEEWRKQMLMAAYDPKWENATTSQKAWKDGIRQKIDGFTADYLNIKGFKSEFEEDILTAYAKKFVLSDALTVMQNLQAQKERVLELERQKKEREEAERAAAEQQKAAEPPVAEPEPVKTVAEEPKSSENAQNPTQNVQNRQETAKAEDKSPGLARMVTLEIIATDCQIDKIKGFISHVGATFTEVE